MLELIRKGLLTGLGLAAITKDKIEEFVNEAVQRGEVSEKEGRELIDRLLKKSEEARHDLEHKVGDLVRATLEKMNIPAREELERLERRVTELERQMEPAPA